MSEYTTPCHICGEPVKLREATTDEAWDHGYDRVDGEYLIGTCRKRYHADGTRTHYTQQVNIVHRSDAEEVAS